MSHFLQPAQVVSNQNFSSFPVEVVRLIFEFSATESDRTASSLVRVSKLVHGWVLPILYETIVIERPEVFLHIVTIIPSGNHPHLAVLVRNVCISLPARFDDNLYQATVFPWDVDKFLRACRNIQNLYINDTYTRFRYPMDCHRHLRHLHCGSWDSWLNHDFLSFDSLTHLRVDLAYNSGIGPSWVPLLPPSTRLPNLTHLAIGTDRRNAASELRNASNFLRRVLARKGVVMVIMTIWFCWSESRSLTEIFAGVSDPRLCVLMMLDSPHGGSSVREWEDEVQGRKSIWDKANVIMKQHREGGGQGVAMGNLEIDPTTDYR
jgi:hypothetical protein